MLLGPIPANWDFGHTERPPDGLMVLSISDDSPFHKQKIVQGDVITTVAGKTVPDVTTLQQILSQTPADQCSLSIAGRSDAVVDVRQ
jgi:S1-C subfamily serine protease